MAAKKNDFTARLSDHSWARHTPDEWQAKCPELKKDGNQLVGPCPHCGGTDRFHVNLKEPWTFGCRQCEDGAAILKAVFPVEPKPKTTTRKEVGRWRYTDAKGDFVDHVRWEPKTFTFEPKGKRGKHWLPLLLNPTAPKSDAVIWAEGEKAAMALQSAGYRAACGPYGAPNNRRCDFSPLAGRQVIMWPDDDDTGRQDANRVAAKLQGVAAEVLWIPTDGETGRDAYDHDQAGIDERIASATPWTPAASRRTRRQSGTRRQRRRPIAVVRDRAVGCQRGVYPRLRVRGSRWNPALVGMEPGPLVSHPGHRHGHGRPAA